MAKGRNGGKQKKQNGSKAPKVVRKLVISQQGRMYGERHVASFPGIGFPDELRCVLKYEARDLDFTGALPSGQVFRGNSLFDPDLTNVGHQPQQFDQLAAAYAQYCVTGFTVEARVLETSGIASDGVLLASSENVSTLTVENLAEGRWSKSYVTSANSGMNRKVIKLPPTSIPMLQGGKDIMDDPFNYSSVTSNPSDPVFAIFKCRSIDAVNSSDTRVSFTLLYQCIFRDLQLNTESLVRLMELRKQRAEYLKTKVVPKEQRSKVMDLLDELSTPKK